MSGNREVHAKIRNLSNSEAAELQIAIRKKTAEIAPEAHGEVISASRNQLPKGWHGWTKALLGGGNDE